MNEDPKLAWAQRVKLLGFPDAIVESILGNVPSPLHIYTGTPGSELRDPELLPTGLDVVPIWQIDDSVVAAIVDRDSHRVVEFSIESPDSHRVLGRSAHAAVGWLMLTMAWAGADDDEIIAAGRHFGFPHVDEFVAGLREDRPEAEDIGEAWMIDFCSRYDIGEE